MKLIRQICLRLASLLFLAFLLSLVLVGDRSAQAAGPGDIVINEIIQNPDAVTDANGEWFELVNTTGSDIDIEGWTIQDNDTDSHVINNGGPLLVPAGGYLVLGINDDSGTNGGVTVDYVFSGIALANGADELVLLDDTLTEIDRVEWDDGATFPDPTGASMALQDPTLDNNVGTNWCTASTPFGDGDLGTPGAANDCPPPPPSTDVVINEIHADPASDLTGDANGDGVRDAEDDEFVEIVNDSGAPFDLSGWTINDEVGVRHTFPGGTIIPTDCAIVVFGGGTPTGTFGGVTVQTASSGTLGLNNGGDTVTLNDGSSDVTSHAYGGEGGNNQSLTRDPDITGSFVQHSSATGSGGALFSPGTMVDGSTFSGCTVVDDPPTVSSTSPSDGATDVAVDANIDINFSEAVTVTGSWFEISCSNTGIHSATVSGGPQNFSLDPDADFATAESCTVTVFAAQVADQDGTADNMAADFSWSFNTTAVGFGVCGDPATLIHDVQGNGSASPLDGTVGVTIEGVVVSNFQGPNQIGGYNVQEEDADVDADPLTSEGLYIFDNANTPSVGDVVRVQGTVTEFNSLTELNAITNFANCGGGGVATAATVSLPVASVDDFEAFEGMLVTFPQTLIISEYFNFDRFGEIVLTTDRRFQPTAQFEPGSVGATQAMQDFLLNRITLDDGRGNQNPDPAIHPNGLDFNLGNLFRGGDTVANVTGVMDFAFGLYRIQPTQGADYTSVNPRTAQPDNVGGNLKVASFNVLNYFTTLDDGVNDICGPNEDLECRGADDAGEFTRQRDKIIAAITAINADVVGLIEIENNINDGPTADLVSGLNDVLGAGTYDYIATGAIGTDAIRVALIYKPASVTPLGAYAVLDSSVDSRFIDTKNRPTLAQTFQDNLTGNVFTLAVNHLKSKGSACDDVGDPDTGDGSGNCNLTRTAAAEALVDWLATDPTGSGDADFLIMGDLNSYDKEDPIDAIHEGSDDTLSTGDDYTDLIFHFDGEFAYSYVFDGQVGYLDHALANANLLDEVTGVTEWHINADEADLIDYDTSFKQPAQDAIYAPDAYRSSDHDPVIVGLSLVPECNGQNATVYVGANGKIVGGPLDGHTYHQILPGTLGDDVIVGTEDDEAIIGHAGDDLICGFGGKDLIDGRLGDDTIFGGEGNDLLRGGFGTDFCDGGDGKDVAFPSCETKVNIP